MRGRVQLDSPLPRLPLKPIHFAIQCGKPGNQGVVTVARRLGEDDGLESSQALGKQVVLRQPAMESTLWKAPLSQSIEKPRAGRLLPQRTIVLMRKEGRLQLPASREKSILVKSPSQVSSLFYQNAESQSMTQRHFGPVFPGRSCPTTSFCSGSFLAKDN